MPTYFQATSDSPYHLSVGAVVVNSHREVCCHYFTEVRGFSDFYILMRETIEPNETIEAALARGLQEEFGMTGAIVTYLGGLNHTFHDHGVKKYKTTLYFLVAPVTHNKTLRDPNDPEFGSDIQWQPIDTLIEIMRKQGTRLKREDLDESDILRRAKTYLSPGQNVK